MAPTEYSAIKDKNDQWSCTFSFHYGGNLMQQDAYQHWWAYETIYAMQLKAPEPAALDAILSIEFTTDSNDIRLDKNFLDGVVRDDDECCSIPLFPELMPLFLIRARNSDLSIVIKYVVSGSTRTSTSTTIPMVPFRLILHCSDTTCPVRYGAEFRDFHIRCTLLQQVSYTLPLYPRAWALKFPKDHCAQGISKIILRLQTETLSSSPFDVEVSSSRCLMDHNDEFPYPLSRDSGFMVIPSEPASTQRSFRYEYDIMTHDETTFDVLYWIGDTMFHLEQENVYYMEDRVIIYSLGWMEVVLP